MRDTLRVDHLDFERWPFLSSVVPRTFLDDVVLFRVFEDEFSHEGQQYVFVLKNDDVYRFNFRNKYTNEKTQPNHEPVKIDRLSGKRVVDVTGSGEVLVWVTKCGRVFVEGRGDNGELGLGIRTSVANFEPITSLSSAGITIVTISSSGNHTVALSASGLVYCWGRNMYGECGRDPQEFWYGLHDPVLLEGLPVGDPPLDVVASRNCSFVLTSSGKVFGLGDNSDGELGTAPGKLEDQEGCACRPTLVPLPEGTVKIRTSSYTALGLGRSGRLYVWGLIQPPHLNIELDPPLASPLSSSLFTPAVLASIDGALDIASAPLGDRFAILTERSIYKLTVGDRTELAEVEGAPNLAQAFEGSLTPTILIGQTTSADQASE